MPSIFAFCNLTLLFLALAWGVHSLENDLEWIPISTPVPDNDSLGNSSPNPIVHLKIGLKAIPENLLLVNQLFKTITDPKHPQYANYLSDQQTKDLLSPSASVMNDWISYLDSLFSKNIEYSISAYNTHITIRLAKDRMEKYLNSEIRLFQHKSIPSFTSYKADIQTLESILPESLQSSIAYTAGIMAFPPTPINPKVISANKLTGPSSKWLTLNEIVSSVQDIEMDPDLNSVNSDDSLGADDSQFIYSSAGDRSVIFLVALVCPDKVTIPQPSYTYLTFVCGTQILSSIVSYRAVPSSSVLMPSPSSLSTLAGTIDLNTVPFKQSGSYYLFQVRIDLPLNYVPYTFSFVESWSGSLTTLNNPSATVGSQTLQVSQLKSFYNFPQNFKFSGSNAVQQAIGAFTVTGGSGFFSHSDLNAFYSSNSLSSSNSNIVTMSGLSNQENDPDGETNLDTQWITGIGYGLITTVFHSPTSSQTPFEDVLEALQSASPRPLVISFSYGADEVSYYSGQPNAVATINNLLQALALQGVSVFASSGDSGSHSASLSSPCTAFRPSFPASSPYLTSVGATQLKTYIFNNISSYCPIEVGCSVNNGALITSGGGFSTVFLASSYQTAAIASYTKNAQCASSLPQSTPYNISNRAYPDISLFGHAYGIFLNGAYQPVDGTSASSPALAGFISLLNDARIKAGQKPFGFLNPLLYSTAQSSPSAFNDIQFGDNKCLQFGASTSCCSDGFSACSGFDAVTGLGTPNFKVLSSLWVNGGLGNDTYGGYAYIEGCGVASSSSSSDSSSTVAIVITVLVVVFVVAGICFCVYRKRSATAYNESQRQYLLSQQQYGEPQAVAVAIPAQAPYGQYPQQPGYGYAAPVPQSGTYAKLPQQ